MKKWLIAALVLTGISTLVVFNRDSIKQAVYDGATRDMFVTRDADDFDPGPVVGSLFPGVQAIWKGQKVRLLNEYYGVNGTVFYATRSAEWCPYCMKQMIQLQEHKAAFDNAGIGIVAMTYDEPLLQRAFIDKWGIEYPMLHDVNALTFKTLGILNEEYQPGDEHYGIPYPGMIVVDTDGVVAGKLFLKDYSVRVDATSSLAYTLLVLGVNEQAQIK